MLKECTLLLFSICITLLVGLFVINKFAPQLTFSFFPSQQQSFFDQVFHENEGNTFILDDSTLTYAQPFFPDLEQAGPHDLLGFRNRAIPHVADIITIGDSMTYGNNAPIDLNWPNRLANYLHLQPQYRLYNMSVGGWGAIEYLEIFNKALKFKPKMVIVAFYSGNDPIDSFKKAYGNDKYQYLRPHKNLKLKDLPRIPYPAPVEDIVHLSLENTSYGFTPKLRLYNYNNAASLAGWKIMEKVAAEIAQLANKQGIIPVFTLIPTKETVYYDKLIQSGLKLPREFKSLVDFEKEYFQTFADSIQQLPNAVYIDLLPSLQTAASLNLLLYPNNENGHPLSKGYDVIAHALHESLPPLPTKLITGPIAIPVQQNVHHLYLIQDDKLWSIPKHKNTEKFGLDFTKVTILEPRDIAYFQHAGSLFDQNSTTGSPQ